MNVFGWYLRRSRSRSSAKSSPIDSLTCWRTPVMASRTFFSPCAASLAIPGSRSGPKMNSAASARTTISPQPIESNIAPPLALTDGLVEGRRGGVQRGGLVVGDVVEGLGRGAAGAALVHHPGDLDGRLEQQAHRQRHQQHGERV